MNPWIGGPIKASCAALPSLPLSPPCRPLSPSLPHFFSFLSSSFVIPFTIPWSSLPPHPYLLIPLFLLTLSPTPFIHPSSRPYILSKTDTALAGCVALWDWFPLDRDFTVGNVGTCAGERFVMLPYKESGVVECVGCNVDGKWRAREEDLKWVPMVPNEV